MGKKYKMFIFCYKMVRETYKKNPL